SPRCDGRRGHQRRHRRPPPEPGAGARQTRTEEGADIRQWRMIVVNRTGHWRRGVLTGLLMISSAGQAAGSPPNILLIVSDDQRPDTIHALGNDLIRTPALDRLVREGLTFTRAVTASPICVASRAELLTGRDGLRNGHGDHGFTPADNVRCLAEVLRDVGYA